MVKKKNINKIILTLLFFVLMLSMTGCGGSEAEGDAIVPVLANSVFTYDEMEMGEGEKLYTLKFTDNSYCIYNDMGVGIVASGGIEFGENNEMTFKNEGGDFSGKYKGSAFESVSVSIDYDGREMKFTPATATTEDVYISYLGTYEGMLGDKDITLILERWNEYYIYTNGELQRGNYEIYADGRIGFTPYDKKTYFGSIEFNKDAEFDISTVKIEFEMKSGGLFKETANLSFATAKDTYAAAHAMGTYTFYEYKNDVFIVKGVDGFLKCMGYMYEEDAGHFVKYFPRKIADDTEEKDNFIVEYTIDGDILSFPKTMPFLPRSGNIDKETGFGSYWQAGSALEFVKNAKSKTSLSEGIEFTDKPSEKSILGGNLPDEVLNLDQIMPSVGKAKPLAILIDFPDFHRPRHVSAEGVQKALFSLEKENSLRAYYHRASYGNLEIEGTVLGWYRAKNNRDYYGSDQTLMAEAISYYIDQGVDMREFDADGNGEIDSLYILWAGSYINGAGGIWSSAYRSTWGSSPKEWPVKVTGYVFTPGITVYSLAPPLSCNTNSLIHETGHLLGLNDYYSYDTDPRSITGDDYFTTYSGGAMEGGLGGLDMMDGNIGDHSAFSKWLLGWLEPNVLEFDEIAKLDKKTVKLKPSSQSQDTLFVKLKDSDDLFTEMFVIECIAPVGNAYEYTRLKEPIVRVIHVDSSVAEEDEYGGWRGFGFKFDNSFTSTKYISTVEADGEDTFMNFSGGKGSNKPTYEISDYFKKGDELTPNTYPNTNAYDKYGNATVPTGLVVKVVDIDKDGCATIELSYEKPEKSLRLKNISPSARIVPYTKDEETYVKKGTKEIVFTYDNELTSSEEQLAEIKAYHDSQEVEGLNASVSGSRLTVTFSEVLKTNNSYTVVIPQGILADKSDSGIVNNNNAIFGFVVEK